MKQVMMIKFDSLKWRMIDEYKVANPFIEVGFRQVKDVVDLRVFDLLNISRINNNRAEEMLLCIYHLLQPDRRIDEGIYNDEIDQYFSYREWKKKHQPLSGVTVREILTTEDLNEVALLRIFDGVTAAFYKSDEYNSREYEKNSKWTPSNVSRNSMTVVWWKCGAGHSYRAKITDRTIEQKGCPQCEAEFQQALPQMLIMMYGAQNGITVKSNSDSELGMRLVAYLPELHYAVDIAGATVTEKREQSVKAHICQSNRLGYYLIKRTADASQMAAEIKTLFIRNHIYLHTDSEKDVQVLRERFLEWKYRNACKLNGKY